MFQPLRTRFTHRLSPAADKPGIIAGFERRVARTAQRERRLNHRIVAVGVHVTEAHCVTTPPPASASRSDAPRSARWWQRGALRVARTPQTSARVEWRGCSPSRESAGPLAATVGPARLPSMRLDSGGRRCRVASRVHRRIPQGDDEDENEGHEQPPVHAHSPFHRTARHQARPPRRARAMPAAMSQSSRVIRHLASAVHAVRSPRPPPQQSFLGSCPCESKARSERRCATRPVGVHS